MFKEALALDIYQRVIYNLTDGKWEDEQGGGDGSVWVVPAACLPRIVLVWREDWRRYGHCVADHRSFLCPSLTRVRAAAPAPRTAHQHSVPVRKENSHASCHSFSNLATASFFMVTL